MPRFCSLITIAFFALTIFVSCEKPAPQSGSEQKTESSASGKAEASPPNALAKAHAVESEGVGSAGVAPTEASDRLIKRSLMWRVEGENGPTYLLGSVHGGLENPTWSDFPSKVRQALADAEVVVLEADLDSVDRRAMLQMSMLPADKSLSAMIGQAAFDKLVSLLGQPAAILDRLQPWAAISGIGVKLMQGNSLSVEKLVIYQAHLDNKEFRYLESVEEQLTMLQRVLSAARLKELLQNFDAQKQGMKSLLDAYMAGNSDEIARLTREDLKGYPKIYEALFVKRNRSWIGKLTKLIERGNVFVTVGAGHLVGEDSVVKMLEEKGYQVERVAGDDEQESVTRR